MTPPGSRSAIRPSPFRGGRKRAYNKEDRKIHDRSGPERLIFSEKFACPVSGFSISEIEPRLFSFNNPFGACPACGGLGVEQHIDADLVIPDKERSLRAGAIAPGPSHRAPITCRHCRRWASTTSSPLIANGRTCPSGPRRRSCMAPATTPFASFTTMGCVRTRRRSRSKA